MARRPSPLIVPPPPITSHSMIVVRKQGRRGIYNLDEMVAYLQGGCKGLCKGSLTKETVRAVAFHTMSMREQLKVVSTATLALSPPGGVSMVLPFMPEGSHAILVNYMIGEGSIDAKKLRGAEGTCNKCSLTMEASLWRHVRWVKTLFYQVWEESDFALGNGPQGAASKKKKKARISRDSAVVVKEERLGYLVAVALDGMRAARRFGSPGA